MGLTGLIAFWIGIRSFQEVITESFRGLKQIGWASVFGGMSTAIVTSILLAVLWLVQGSADLKTIVTFVVTGTFFILTISVILLFKHVQPISTKGSIGWGEMSGIAKSVFATNITTYILNHADLWIIGAFRSSEDIALYGSASRLMTLVITPLLIVNLVVQPFIVEMYAKAEKKGSPIYA